MSYFIYMYCYHTWHIVLYNFFDISKTEKKENTGHSARPSIVCNRLTEIENELKAIEEDEKDESHKNKMSHSSLEDESEDYFLGN